MTEKTLLIGIGNASRGDDGLGWAFADRLAGQLPPSWTLEYRYQLVVEDAELLTRYSRVVFVDACQQALSGGFALELCAPDASAGIYTHQQTPGAVLYLCKALYAHQPEAWRLCMQGYAWELGDPISLRAQENLERGVAAFKLWLRECCMVLPDNLYDFQINGIQNDSK